MKEKCTDCLEKVLNEECYPLFEMKLKYESEKSLHAYWHAACSIALGTVGFETVTLVIVLIRLLK